MRRIIVIAAAAILAACQSPPPPAPAPRNDPPASPVAEAEPKRPPIAGGYGAANTETEEAKAARALAEKALYERAPTRARIESATSEVQVVAGLNYRFNFTLSNGETWQVVVFRPLRGALEVTSVTEMKR